MNNKVFVFDLVKEYQSIITTLSQEGQADTIECISYDRAYRCIYHTFHLNIAQSLKIL